jgi:hypothetical protein
MKEASIDTVLAELVAREPIFDDLQVRHQPRSAGGDDSTSCHLA